MKYIYTIDSDGFYVPEALKREPDDYINKKNEIDTPIADGFYSPKWSGEKWVEGGSPPEPAPYQTTETDQLRADVDYLAVMTGVDL